MTQYNLGRVCPIFQGDYNPEASYECLDVVLYEGSSYVAKMDTIGNFPTDPNFWQLVASAGTGGGGTGIVDSELSLTSKNPVQNKVITLKINDLESIIVPEETVRQIVEGYQYMNQSQVETAITSKGYQNAEQVETAIVSKKYAKKTDIATINGQTITNGGNITIEGGGAAVTVDSQMSLDSENPVQNKVITKRINEVEGKIKPIPTKVSELNNDSGFQTKSDVDSNIAGQGFQTASQVNAAIEGKGYTTMAAVQAQNYQTKNQVDINITDRNYTTLTEVNQQGFAKSSEIPTDNAGLTNGAGYVKKVEIATINGQTITEGGNITIEGGGASVVVDSQLSTESENPVQNKIITAKINQVEASIPTDTVTAQEVETAITSKGYQTSSQVETAITSKGYQTSSDIDARGYTTLEAVAQQGYAMNSDIPTNNNQLDNGANYTTMAAVEGKGYQTSSDVSTAIDNQPTEAWEFELEDGSTITKNILVKA